MSYEQSDKKQLEAESREVMCVECLKISFYGDWEFVNPRVEGTSRVGGLRCPKCGFIHDLEDW